MKQIFLIIVVFSVSIWAGFSRDNRSNIVTDSSTRLQWQDDANVTKTWTEAITYCEVLTLGNYSNWRLPNFNELYFIADRTKREPAMDTTFQNVVSGSYWSSSSVVGHESRAWVVNFRYGGSGFLDSKSNYSHYVRCVRDEQ